jgi:hypothetical protein
VALDLARWRDIAPISRRNDSRQEHDLVEYRPDFPYRLVMFAWTYQRMFPAKSHAFGVPRQKPSEVECPAGLAAGGMVKTEAPAKAHTRQCKGKTVPAMGAEQHTEWSP